MPSRYRTTELRAHQSPSKGAYNFTALPTNLNPSASLPRLSSSPRSRGYSRRQRKRESADLPSALTLAASNDGDSLSDDEALFALVASSRDTAGDPQPALTKPKTRARIDNTNTNPRARRPITEVTSMFPAMVRAWVSFSLLLA
jgi:hypothetical protein